MNINDSYTFILYFNGVPWPNITLFFNNEILSNTTSPYSPVSLILQNLSMTDEGIYYVRLMNR